MVQWIAGKGGRVTAREVQMGCRWLREAGAAEAMLDVLVKAGSGTWQAVEPTGKGGRPSRVFQLVNGVNVNETPTNPEENIGCVDVDSVDEPQVTVHEDDLDGIQRMLDEAADDGKEQW